VEKSDQGGETARILLRQAVRERDDRSAVQAASILADLRDDRAFPVVADRLARDIQTPVRPALIAALVNLSDAADAKQAAKIWAKFRNEPLPAARGVADLLGRIVEKQCGGDPARLDGLAQAPGLAAQLQDYVARASFCTNDAELAAWGVKQCYRYGLVVPGIRGAYYEGANFETRVFERIDGKIDFPNGQFDYPDKRESMLSIRWTGRLVAPQAGTYKFRIPCDDGHRLSIDGKRVSDLWDSVCEGRAEVTLQAGAHDFLLEYKACPAPNYIQVFWTGPDGVERLLSKENLRCVPLSKK